MYNDRINLYNKLKALHIKQDNDCQIIKNKTAPARISVHKNLPLHAKYIKSNRTQQIIKLGNKIQKQAHKIKCDADININFQYVRVLTYNFEKQIDQLEKIILELGDVDETIPLKLKLTGLKKKLHKINHLIQNETCDNIAKISKYTEELGKDIPKFEKVIQYLNKGGSGKIFTSCINNLCFAIKVMNIYEFFLRKENIMNTRYNRWREIQVLKWSTELVISKKTQNLPLFYDYQICWDKEMPYILLYNELLAGTFKKWCLKLHTIQEWYNFLAQYFCVLYMMQKKYGFVHNDLTWDNILYLPTDKTGLWQYQIDNINLLIEDLGFVFVLWDFGSCQSLKFNNKVGERDDIINKLKKNTDLDYFLDLPKRMKMTLLVNRYSLAEMKDLLKSPADIEYLKKETNKVHEEVKRFNDPEREMFVLQKNLAFYLVEQNRFDKLYKKEFFKADDEVVLPPTEIINLLQKWNTAQRQDTSFYLNQLPKISPSGQKTDLFAYK
jgi:hypothetical protein